MFTPFIRLLLLAVCTSLSVLAAVYNIWSLLIFSSILSVAVMLGYFRSSTMPLVLKAIMVEDYPKAKRLISYITKPDKLSNQNLVLYGFCQGLISRNEEDNVNAKHYLTNAYNAGIKYEPYRVMCLMALADMCIVQGEKKEARYYFSKIKDLKVHKNMMEDVRKMQGFLNV